MIIQTLGSVTKDAHYQWSRPVDGASDIHISIGDVVGEERNLATVRKSAVGERINLSKLLKVPVREVQRYLKCWPGEIVHKGDIVAEKIERGGVMIFEVKVTSPGMIDFSEIHKGFLIIKGPMREAQVLSHLDGKVTSIIPHKNVSVETEVFKIRLFEVLGEEQDGELIFVDKENISKLKSAEIREKVVITDAVVDEKLLWQLSKVGINGLVVNMVDVHLLKQVHHDIHMIDEVLGYGIGFLSGFGPFEMPEFFKKIFKKIGSGSLGKVSRIDKSLVLSDQRLFTKQFLDQIDRKYTKLRKGLKVKVMSGEWWGCWGKVVDYKDNSEVIIELENNDIIALFYKNVYAF